MQKDELTKRRYVPAAQTRALFLRAAAEAFSRFGVEGATVSDIVARAGLHQPGFYRHFENKEGAHEAIVAAFRAELRELVEQALVPPEVPAGNLQAATAAALLSLVQFLNRDRATTAVAFCQEPAGETTRNELTAMIAVNIEAEVKAGHFRKDLPPMLVAECLVGIVTQLFWRSGSDTSTMDEEVRMIASFLLNGVVLRT